MKKRSLLFCFLFLHVLIQASAQRQLEWLGRGVHAATQTDGNVFISWRLLGNDAAGISFNVYRQQADVKAIRLNQQPVTSTTSFIDTNPDTTNSYSYFVKTLLKGKEGAASAPFLLKPGTRPYVSLPLQTPAGYTPNDASPGDLDGNGL